MVIKSVNTATARLGQYFPLFDKAQKDRNLIFLLLSKLS